MAELSRGRILFAGAGALFLLLGSAFAATLVLSRHLREGAERSRRALLRETEAIAARERAGRQRLRARFGRELRERCSPHFDAARREAAAAAQKLGSLSACVPLGIAAVRDRMNGTRKFEEAYLAILDRPVIRPCLLAERAARETLAEYALRLRENHLEFTVALATACGNMPRFSPSTEPSPQLRQMLETLAGRTLSLHSAKASALLGVALELAFVRSGCRSAARLFSAAAAKFCGSLPAAGVCAAADGPLPVGDVVGGILTIAGGVWTACDLYEVSCVLPRQLAEELDAAIGNAGKQLVADSEARAADLDRIFREEAEAVAAEVRRSLGPETKKTQRRRRP